MPASLMTPRVKKPYDRICDGIYAGNVWSLVVVTRKTCERKIARRCSPTVFYGNDVIDLMDQRCPGLWQ